MKLSFRQRLFLYFSVLFALFTLVFAILGHYQEIASKREAMEERLDAYADMVITAEEKASSEHQQEIHSLYSFLPADLRISIINDKGKVLFDNDIDTVSTLENHLSRPEIKQTIENGKGSDIRTSASNAIPYLYYAKEMKNGFVRVALPYNLQLKQFLKPDNIFLYFLGISFLLFLLLLHRVTVKFGTSVRQLRDFALQGEQQNFKNIRFPDDELGEIGTKLTENYRQLSANKKNLGIEKQKLLQHIQISEEGVCFLSPKNEVELYNGLFLQYVNQLIENPSVNIEKSLEDPIFAPVKGFLKRKKGNYFETEIRKQGKIFSLQVNIFKDKSSEIILNDITRQEKTKQLKKELTGNIAHELRTPVTSISAYLETLIEQDLPEDKKQHFLSQAYKQTQNLSAMIKDMGLIAKMEEATNTFKLETVNLVALLNQVKEEMGTVLNEKEMQMSWLLPDHLSVNGNAVLLYSLFKNLTENAIRYAGNHTEIKVLLFNEDENFYYFSFYDTGAGIEDEAHLNRLFERFYRVQEGRTRDTGGTGLGLSIVKNAVLFHQGNISVKNRKDGGLEFIFKLHK